ncbi:PAP2 domain protein [Talaromyces stipitatus ATCC 10500]|uniref:PAP2 domain protein n=1 Tax=Talaromyces stipitatus (strain ATCC 10500 / CBS 375.48 / QM 6759 / NRRL 1006) TaxID=441959 RepID=B8M3X8_TALSN|nr:PAP2 domain protein [Talaromyces stipitatus ATCC 10500]EED20721.1 PAP2 domain protein [Talaromyces stipitatus ATCC 10500]
MSANQVKPAIVRISKLLVTSYILDWILIAGLAGIGGGFSSLTPSQRPFSLTDPDISLPYKPKDTVSSGVLIVIGLVIPAAIILLFSFALVPSLHALKGTPFALIWRRKIWEWNAGWMGLALALAATFTATEGLKDLIGKPRPDLIGRCDPDLSQIERYAVGGLGALLQGAPTFVTYEICRNQGSELKNDGFAAWPSGHSSFSFAGMLYLTLWLCAKFSVSFPYLGPLPFGTRSPAAAAPPPPAAPPANSHLQKAESESTNSFTTDTLPTSTSPRDQGAAPPVYLQILVFVPICVAFFVACSRYHDHRHAGFDIISGSALGIFFAYVGFHMYHLPLRRSDGWAWSARSRRHAFFRGVGYADLTVTEGWAGQEPISAVAENEVRGEEQV